MPSTNFPLHKLTRGKLRSDVESFEVIMSNVARRYINYINRENFDIRTIQNSHSRFLFHLSRRTKLRILKIFQGKMNVSIENIFNKYLYKITIKDVIKLINNYCKNICNRNEQKKASKLKVDILQRCL